MFILPNQLHFEFGPWGIRGLHVPFQDDLTVCLRDFEILDLQPAETRSLSTFSRETMGDNNHVAKRLKLCGKPNPTSFITWNVNGFTSRCTKDCQELKHLMETTGYPDVVCLQEVRLKASRNRGVPLESELEGGVQNMLRTVFQEYATVYWSLADSRYSGTLTLLHNRVDFRNGTAAFTPDTAITALAKQLGVSRENAGLPPEAKEDPNVDKATSGTSKAKQTSLTSFFKPAAPKKDSPSSKPPRHHKEGRFQCLLFPDFDLIQTYVPNNGLKHESIQRRRDWDETMLQFFQWRQKLLKHVGKDNDRPILWCGDLNCALTYRDGTHWTRSSESNEVIEYWTDESKSLTSSSKRDEGRHQDDMGIPSFTKNERRRLSQIMGQADLVDVWRDRFPDGDRRKEFADPWEAPNYTWRGHMGKTGNFLSKYEGKGQRLDYFLVSAGLKCKIQECEILGFGSERHGFCGSDHCPLLLRLKDDVAMKTEQLAS